MHFLSIQKAAKYFYFFNFWLAVFRESAVDNPSVWTGLSLFEEITKVFFKLTVLVYIWISTKSKRFVLFLVSVSLKFLEFILSTLLRSCLFKQNAETHLNKKIINVVFVIKFLKVVIVSKPLLNLWIGFKMCVPQNTMIVYRFESQQLLLKSTSVRHNL